MSLQPISPSPSVVEPPRSISFTSFLTSIVVRLSEPSARKMERMSLSGRRTAARPLIKPCCAFALPSVKPQLSDLTSLQLFAFLSVAAALEYVAPYLEFVRYLAKPTPIVLCDLTAEGISIEGITTPTECKLSELLHQEILDRAVQLAVTSRVALNKVQK